MSQQSQDETRTEARAVLAHSWTRSVGAVGVVLVAGCAVAGLVLNAQGFTWANTSVAISVLVGTAVLVFFVADMAQHHRCRVALKDVLNSEKSYELLLQQTRQERDEAKARADQARVQALAQVEVFRTLQMVQQAQPPVKEQDE